MNKNNELICAHSALVFAVMMGVGIFGIAGWLPLIPPGMNAADLATQFSQNREKIRIGMSVLALSSGFWWTFSAAISMRMKKIEGESHPLTYVQMAAASGTVLVILFSAYFWLAAAYRPSTDPATLQIFNDIAWLMFVGAYPPAFIQNMSIAICVLNDKNEVKIYPRWVGYFNIWITLLSVPGALLPFFTSGPFAWNGIIGFWVVANAFFGWILVMWWMTVVAIKREAAAEVR
jgi:hypothetical protein